MSPTYSANAGNDDTSVYGGSLTIVANNMTTVRPFELSIPFSTPFLYDPSKGNLSLYMVTSSGPTNLTLDAQFAAGDSVGRVYGGFSTTGAADTLGLITRLDVTAIPEPSPTALLLTAVFALGLSRCFKKSRAPKR